MLRVLEWASNFFSAQMSARLSIYLNQREINLPANLAEAF